MHIKDLAIQFFFSSKRERRTVDLCLLQARRSIVLCWKSVSCPSLGPWLQYLTSSLPLEKLIYRIWKKKKKKATEFDNVWGMFWDFVKKNVIL